MENLESVKDQISILSNMSTDGTKLSPTSSLRCRSRSCSRASSSDDSFNTAVNQVSQGYVSTPGYGLSFHPRGQRGHELDRSRKISRDSGFGAGTPMGDISDWSNNSSVSKLKMKASQLIEGSPTLNDLQKQWRKKKVSLYSSSPVKKSMFTYRTAEMLPLYVVLLTFGAGLFTLIVLNNALSKNNVRPSTAFVKPKTAAEKVKIDDLVDEFGNPLGGKKAAIQYYHNLNTQKSDVQEEIVDYDPENVRITSNQDQEQDLNEELLKKLTLELSHSITELHKEVMADEATKKKLLLDKLSQSGHFGTTFVKPDVALEPEKVADETQVKKVSKREASQPMISPNDNPLLFRISDVNIVKDEEEFRFLPEQ